MAMMIKYKLNELAKDFNLGNKDIAAILTKYAEAPKSTMKALDEKELDIIFESLTQDHQMASLAEIYETPVKEEPAPKQTAEDTQKASANQHKEQGQAKQKGEEKAASVTVEKNDNRQEKNDKPADRNIKQDGANAKNTQQNKPGQPNQNKFDRGNQNKNGQNNTQQNNRQNQNPVKNNNDRNNAPAPKNNNQAPVKPAEQNNTYTPRNLGQKRVIDTSGVTINIDKYDEHIEELVPESAQNMRRGKEKIVKKNQQNSKAPANSAKKRQSERDRMQKLQLEVAKKAPTKVQIPDEINVGELAARMKKTGSEVVRQLIKLGIMASVSETIDYDTAALVAMELGCKVEREVVVTIEETLIDDSTDAEEDLEPRAPVVVVMGHVDHGKTSLLDRIRSANVASGEAGGITQHIGAYRTQINGSPITFLDTPGHEAFTTMRARGAMVTDLAILMVAADDGIMPQTIESINHAKAAGIPIIVAINKMDLPHANPDRIMQQLMNYNLVPEEWGGDTIVCPVSAKTGMGIDNLLENIAVSAEILELKANPNRPAKGTVIEARLDKGRGPIMTVLIQNGTLKQGDIIIAGTCVGRVRVMTDDKGRRITEAGPSVPVEVAGMSEVPNAGDIFNVVSDERMAHELAEQRKAEKQLAANTPAKKISLDDLFAQIKEGELKELNIIVKADVQGSAEAVKASLEKLTNEEVRVKVIHSGVGAINESDVMLASTSDAIIVGFNVRPDAAARDSAERNKVDLRMYRVIYDCIEEIQAAMKGMLAPKFHEVLLGHAEVRMVYHVSKVGTVCGCYVQDGKIVRGCGIRVVRDGIVVHEGELESLRRFKDDVREVQQNFECGMQIAKFNDIKEGDILEAFTQEEIAQ